MVFFPVATTVLSTTPPPINILKWNSCHTSLFKTFWWLLTTTLMKLSARLSPKAHPNLVHGILVTHSPLLSHDLFISVTSSYQHPRNELCVFLPTASVMPLCPEKSLSSQSPAICRARFWSTCLLSEFFLCLPTHSPGSWVTTHIFTLLMQKQL